MLQSSMEKTFMINQLIQMSNDMKKLENSQQDKLQIILVDVYEILNTSKIIID